MTVIAGLKTYQGVVLLADTQETVEHSKRHVSKLRFEPSNVIKRVARIFGSKDNDEGLAIAFCGAGEGPFIDKLVELSWRAAFGAKDISEASDAIADVIEGSYKKYGKIYQHGYCPQVDLIYGVKMNRTSKLFQAAGPIINEKERYCSSGIGSYMAEFLLARMYADHLTIHQCVILAAYILFQAKEHVDGCGGESQIAVLRENGASGLIDKRIAEAITKNLEFSDHDTGHLLLAVADPSLTDEKYKEAVETVIERLESWRNIQRKDFEEQKEFHHHCGQCSDWNRKKPMSSDWLCRQTIKSHRIRNDHMAQGIQKQSGTLPAIETECHFVKSNFC